MSAPHRKLALGQQDAAGSRSYAAFWAVAFCTAGSHCCRGAWRCGGCWAGRGSIGQLLPPAACFLARPVIRAQGWAFDHSIGDLLLRRILIMPVEYVCHPQKVSERDYEGTRLLRRQVKSHCDAMQAKQYSAKLLLLGPALCRLGTQA